MAQRDLLNRSLDVGKDVTQRTQERIEELLREVAKSTEDQIASAQQAIQELLDRSRESTEVLLETIDHDVRAELQRIEGMLEQLTGIRVPSASGVAQRMTRKAPAA